MDYVVALLTFGYWGYADGGCSESGACYVLIEQMDLLEVVASLEVFSLV